jgi:D-alanyl-D-alanine carboxypeptidase
MSPAPPGVQQGLDDLVAAGIPGVVAYVRHGNAQWRLSSGVADRATNRPAQAADRVRIGSNTKSFVSTVLLQLEAEHRLSLDDTVGRWLPGVVSGNGNDGSTITVRQLLNHTSGLYDYVADPRVLTPYVVQHDWACLCVDAAATGRDRRFPSPVVRARCAVLVFEYRLHRRRTDHSSGHPQQPDR